jgi:16S rRNA (cytosine1402-N4)-methyltransferase
LLLDLGVSSHQLNQARRGFGFRSEGPLDMRMDPTTGETVSDLLERVEARDLARILKEFGEVPGAWRLSNRILEAYGAGEIRSTKDLADVVVEAAPQALRRRRVHPATLVFQAIRIAVNDELGEVERVLNLIPETLAVGGTAAVISFHSLEDRRVKWTFREFAGRVRGARPISLGPDPEPDFVEITRKPICPSEDEVKRNPRARSAKLRVLRRLAKGGGKAR